MRRTLLKRLGRSLHRGYLVEKHPCQQLFFSDVRFEGQLAGIGSSGFASSCPGKTLLVASYTDAATNHPLEHTDALDTDAGMVADTHANSYNEKQNLKKSRLVDVRTVTEHTSLFVDRLRAAATGKKTDKEHGTDKDPACMFLQQLHKFLRGADIGALETVLDRTGITCKQFVDWFVKLENVDFQTFTSVISEFEKLGICGISIVSIIKKDVQVLSSSSDEIQAGLRFLKGIMIPEDELPALIQRYPLILKAEFRRKISLLDKELRAFASKDSIIRKAVSCQPERVHWYSKGRATEVVEFLTGYGFTNDRLDCMLQKHAWIILTDVKSSLKCNVQFLEDLGLVKEVIYKVINKCPNFLLSSWTDNLMAKLEYFKTIGFNETEFSGIVERYPHIFMASIENKIKPVVVELQTLGLTDEDLKKVVLYRPSLFGLNLGGQISGLVKSLSETSHPEGQKATAFMKMYARAPDHRKLCEECLVRHGLLPAEAQEVVDKEPGILGYTEEALAVKLETLTGTLDFPIKDVLKVPEYLSFKLRKRIQKRQRVLTYMKSKGLLARPFTLKQLVLNSNSQFYNSYVKVYAVDKVLSKLWLKDRDI